MQIIESLQDVQKLVLCANALRDVMRAAAHLLVEKMQVKLASRDHGDAELGAQGLVQCA